MVEHDQPEFNDLLTSMGPGKRIEGARAIILLDVWKVCLIISGGARQPLMANYNLLGSNLVWIWCSYSDSESAYRGRRGHSGNE